jgi:protein-arginine kinase activator protein McsA
LELQLEEALEREDYERAAEIRDLLNPPKRRRKGRPKNLDN